MVTSSLLLALLPLSFFGLWVGISKLLALFGWQKLATSYQVAHLPAGPRKWLALVYVGVIQYQRVIRAGASADGLALSVIFPFRVGHPPLLIPWRAIGPLYYKKKWLRTTYEITVRTSEETSVKLEFEDKSLLAVLQQWLPVTALSKYD